MNCVSKLWVVVGTEYGRLTVNFFDNSAVLRPHINASFDMCRIMYYVTVRVAQKIELLVQNKGLLKLLC